MIIENTPLTDNILTELRPLVTAVKYLAIDPGKANGVCGYNAEYQLAFMFTIRDEDMLKFLDCFEAIEQCICENYTLYPNKAMKQVYSDMPTSRVIGRIEGWAARNKVTLTMQPASIKATGYAWIGKKPLPKSNPRNHEWDAHVHFMYWAVKNRKINASVLLQLNRGNRDSTD